MITIQQIEQGESLQPQFTIYVDDGITPYNLDNLDNVIVWFVENKSNEVYKKYSLNAKTDHDTSHFVVIDAASGQFIINIESSVTDLWNDGLVRFEISIEDTVEGFTTYKKICKENLYKVKPNEIHAI